MELIYNGLGATYHCEIALIWGSIGCALSLKFCTEAWAHAFQRTQKAFWEIPPKSDFIKIINIFNGVPKPKHRKIKILMGINLIRGETSRKRHGLSQNDLSL